MDKAEVTLPLFLFPIDYLYDLKSQEYVQLFSSMFIPVVCTGWFRMDTDYTCRADTFWREKNSGIYERSRPGYARVQADCTKLQ